MVYEEFEKNNLHEIKISQLMAFSNICFYLLISITKLIVGHFSNSTALKADGYNGATDTLAYFIIILGLMFARRPADQFHKFGYAKAETLATLMTSVLISETGMWVIYKGINALLNKNDARPDFLAAFVGIGMSILTLIFFLINRHIAKKINSQPLLASSHDQRLDAITSITTGIVIIISSFSFAWIDKINAIIIGIFMMRTAYKIFDNSAFRLIDGFDKEKLKNFSDEIQRFKKIKSIQRIQGREYENDIYLSVVVQVGHKMTVDETVDLKDDIQDDLRKKFGIFELDMQFITKQRI
ncbi:cation diffusion facilitator family transporter [Companilactobacillus insicii]|uniref:cation diffusion facilitator family transporter n=1 Tax=Companilactobacillus insicii TaxID=1732567 RepID=UPI000F7898D1|nr:cation diffusion facilitator family transporter [Companilactobacillus insicii]